MWNDYRDEIAFHKSYLMDFGTMKKKLHKYESIVEFWQDVDTIFQNCKWFNETSSGIYMYCEHQEALAKAVKEELEAKYAAETGPVARASKMFVCCARRPASKKVP